ncbi:hypothetical protein AJ79_00503 [Helicocarpus griseus UAMH5409]|uniref:Box C/D snoRNA protein 1 n=1 Tax=Helicocarpus griseus UAMH5409 TaxID=1447875 RepID=A0A2B7Y2X4_9EURO|nr:hypothetical protein AJ79_00503 [Helicocarpus griseus UAMH5409]
MSKSKELSLSELCTICRINEPKYKCPRCATPTCSLPCSKRHKLWSQCSGVRDPAAYLKRKELATPVAFDKDFNFISGIERHVERAEREAENRGIELAKEDFDDGDGQRKRRRTEPAKKGEVGLLRGIESAGVRVVRAPKGMSRGRQNLSYWHKKHKCLSWTIEWVMVDGDNTQKAINKCLETTSVTTAFARTSLAKDEEEEYKATAPPTKKQTLDSEIMPPPPSSSTPIYNTSAPEMHDETGRCETPLSHTLSPEPIPKPTPNQDPDNSGEPENENENEATISTPAVDTDSKCNNSATDSNPDSKTSSQQKHHFYLHRPQTRSRVPVLIPLEGSVTITDALRNRTVLEFPTFYVLPCAPGELSGERFMLEEVYLKENGADDDLEIDKGGEEDSAKGDEEGEVDDDDVLPGVDQKKVLEVLYKDLQGEGVSV